MNGIMKNNQTIYSILQLCKGTMFSFRNKNLQVIAI